MYACSDTVRARIAGAPSSRLGARLRACPGRCIESTACHHSARTEPHLDISSQGQVDSITPVSDSRASYRRAGLLVGNGDVPFVGAIAFIAGTASDSTLVLIDLSLSDRALTFTREGEAYRAAYDVVLDFQRGGSSIKHIATHEQVRVGSFRETTRDEESVIYQQIASLPPGDATVEVSIHDAGSTRTGVMRQPVSVPRFDDGTVTAPIPAFGRGHARRDRSYRRSSSILARPRCMVATASRCSTSRSTDFPRPRPARRFRYALSVRRRSPSSSTRSRGQKPAAD